MNTPITMPIKNFKKFIIDEIEKSFDKTQTVQKVCVMLNRDLEVMSFPLVITNVMDQQIMENVLIPTRVKEVGAKAVAFIADSTFTIENKHTKQVDEIDVIAVLVETETSAETIIWEIIKRNNKLTLVKREDLMNMLTIVGKYLNVTVTGGASIN